MENKTWKDWRKEFTLGKRNAPTFDYQPANNNDVHIIWYGGQPLHHTHSFRWHAPTETWACERCGHVACQRAKALRRPCRGEMSKDKKYRFKKRFGELPQPKPVFADAQRTAAPTYRDLLSRVRAKKQRKQEALESK